MTSLEAKGRKGGREEEERRGEKEGGRKRGNGSNGIASQDFCSVVDMSVRMRVCTQVLSQNIKCSSYCVLPTK